MLPFILYIINPCAGSCSYLHIINPCSGSWSLYSTLLIPAQGHGVISTLLISVQGHGVISTLLIPVWCHGVCSLINGETLLEVRSELRSDALLATTIDFSGIRTHDSLCANPVF